MSFSWWCKDKAGKDLFDEFEINRQALGLWGANMETPHYGIEIRQEWMSFPCRDKPEDTARDALAAVQSMVRDNLACYAGPVHPECPSCTCKHDPPGGHIPFDIEQAKRFLSIPLDRVWRAGGGY